MAPLASYDHSYDYPLTPLGDPSKRAFTYAVLGGARFVYASAARLIAVKFISSMAMSEVKIKRLSSRPYRRTAFL